MYEVEAEYNYQLGNDNIRLGNEVAEGDLTFLVRYGAVYLYPAGNHTFKIEGVFEPSSIKQLESKYVDLSEYTKLETLNEYAKLTDIPKQIQPD